ncbi:MAG: hypothetical protein N3B21_14260 [Clostridia bacterium]|nr:hypothetical protein [Clostridia bacterium]
MDEQTKLLIDASTKIVAQNLEKICKCIVNLGKDAINNSRIGNGEAFSRYLQSAIEKYSKVKTILYKHTPVYLYDFYINVDLISDGNVISTENVLDILERDRYVIITASGGAGKSTLFKHLFLNTIEKTTKIPIFVELKDLNNNEYTLKECIYNTISNLKFDLEEKYFYEALESGCFVFYFDAFDEIQENKKNLVAKEIIDISDKYDNNYYIVSSRLSDRFVGWNRFKEMNVIPLSKEQSVELIKKLKYDDMSKEKFLIELDQNLYDKHSSFASNPLLLTIMLMTFDQYAKIPEKVHLFYQQAFETLYSKHDATKGVFSRQMGTDLAIDDFTKILSSFCTLSYIDSNTTFDNGTVIEYLSNAKKLEGIKFNVENFKRDLIESVCILIQDGLGYAFTHRSFQEYFTARFISNLSSEEQQDLLKKLFYKKPASINIDIVFDILFDIKKEALEKNFIIPLLDELKTITSSTCIEGQYFKYLKLIYNSIELDYVPDDINGKYYDEEQIVYSVRLAGIKYYELVNFVNRKYVGYPSSDVCLPFSSKSNDKEFIRKHGISDEHKPIPSINFATVKFKSEIFYKILELAFSEVESFHFCLSILEFLENEHVEKKQTRDLLFTFKDSTGQFRFSNNL